MVESRVRPPNIHDVARVAGVSYQTVSKVLNDHPSIRQSTRARVLDAVTEVGYRPNLAARALVTSRSGTIGVLSTETVHYGPATSLNAIGAAARSAGYRPIVTSPSGDDSASIRSALEYLLNQYVEALVVVAPHMMIFDVLEDLAISVPYVTLIGPQRGPSVSVDQLDGARLATSYLVGLGHTEIAHISGPNDWIDADARSNAFLAELAEHDLTPASIAVGDWTASSGYECGLDLLRKRDFTAVFCANDQMALGFLHACRELGVAVPGDVSVVGFDDMPEAAHFFPPLTTVRQNFAEIGERAISLLLAQLSGELPEDQVPVPAQLVIRASAAEKP